MVGESRAVARERARERDEVERGIGRASWPDGGQQWPEVALVEALEPGQAARSSAPARGAGSRPRQVALPAEVVEELAGRVDYHGAARMTARLVDAAGAYQRERYQDAQRMLVPLMRAAPDAPALRELMGLCLYRQGKWGEAIRHLEVFARVSGSLDQYPVLADCHRALGHAAAVRELWDELRTASPSAELVAEGRIVMAEALADEGRLDEAIDLLGVCLRARKVTREHHLRQWYALADLYERAGDLARARELFGRVAEQDADLADVGERLAALGGAAGRPGGSGGRRGPGDPRLSRSRR